MQRFPLSALGAALLIATGAAHAQVLQPPPQNVLSLAAQASAEVQQDMLSITLAATRDGSDAATVQSQLKQVLDAALTEARKAVKPGQLDVRTGQFATYPRYAPKGGVAGWQGRAELILEGRDFAAISQLAGRLPGLVVTGVGYGLSREARLKAEGDVAAQAITRFKARAEDYARQFGFAGYGLREIIVGQADGGATPMPRMRAMSAGAVADDSAVPVEAGKTTVTVTVNGSIQMSAR